MGRIFLGISVAFGLRLSTWRWGLAQGCSGAEWEGMCPTPYSIEAARPLDLGAQPPESVELS